MTDVLNYLQSKNLDLKRGTANNVHTSCFWCSEDPEKRGRLYINVDPDADIPGLYKCFLCDARGSLVTIKRYFGDQIDKEEEIGQELYAIFQTAAAYYHDELSEHDEALGWLRGPKRSLTMETIVDAQLGYAAGGLYRELKKKGFQAKDILATGLVMEDRRTQKLVDSLNNMVTIPYFVAGSCVGIRGRAFPYDKDSQQPKYKTCGGTKSRLFNSDVTWRNEEIAICEGEFDALALTQIGQPAVGVPGARNWQENWDGYMTEMRRMWLVFDPDPVGDEGAKKLAARFGARIKRVRLAINELPVDVSDWIAAGHVQADWREAQLASLTGGLLITVDEALAEHAELQGQEGLKFNHPELDHWIAPGLLGSQVLVVLAKTGTGKTLFCLNVMHSMRMVPGQENLRFLFVSLEQTRGEWYERARRIHRFHNLEATDRDVLHFWRDNLMITDKNRMTEEDLLSALDDYEYRMGGPPDVVVLDYLGYWAQSFKGDRYQKTSDAVMTLKAIAKERRLPIITPHQVSRIAKFGEEPDADSARDAGVIEETADFMFLLWSQDALQGRSEEEKSGIVHLRIGKSRHGGRGVKADYRFAPLSLTLIPQHNTTDIDLLKRATNELTFERDYRDSWEQAVYRHRTGMLGHLEPNPGFQEQMLHVPNTTGKRS